VSNAKRAVAAMAMVGVWPFAELGAAFQQRQVKPYPPAVVLGGYGRQ
jgi:hypothetical protein